MNRTTRSVAAAALAAVVALGAVAPAAAAPQGGPGKPDKVAVKAEKQKPAKDRAAKQEQPLKRMAERKAGYLDRLSTRHKVERLGAVGEVLAANMLADANDELRVLDPADSEAAALIRSARPAVYNRIINQARLIVVNELDPTLVEPAPLAEEIPAEATTVVEDTTVVEETSVAEDTTVVEDAPLLQTVLEFNAWTTKSELKVVQKRIAALLDELEEEEQLDEDTTLTDPPVTEGEDA